MPRRPPTSTGHSPGRPTLEPRIECVPARRAGRVPPAVRPAPAVDPSKLVVPPPPPGGVPRPRIGALLDAAPGPLRTVSAPAGYGRTTALADWARGADRRCAWLAVDPRDDDPEHLRVHVRAALDGLPAGAPGTLVVDDAHRITSAAASEVLRALADAPPHGVRVIVASRSSPELPGDAPVPTVGADALAMTAAESAAVLRARGLDLDRTRSAAAHAASGGWPAAVGLVADAVAGAPGWRTFAGSLEVAQAAVARRVGSDVLPVTDEELRELLLRTAVLRRPDADACAAVLGVDDVGDLLDRARRLGILADATDGGVTHRGPFRPALLALLADRDPGEATRLHERAATWFGARGAPGPAAEHAAASGDGPRADAIAEAHVARRGAAPGEGDPWPADIGEARRAFDAHPDADATVAGAASAAIALALWRAGRDDEVRAHLEPRIGAIAHPAPRSWSLALLALAVAAEHPERAEALARQARRISRRPGATWLEPVLAHLALGDALRARGDLGAAHVALGEAAVRTGGVPRSVHHGTTLLLRAELAIAAGDPRVALRVLTDGDLRGAPAARVGAARERARRLAADG